MPQRRAGGRVDGLERLIFIAKKYQAASCGHGATTGIPTSYLRIFPRRLVRAQRVGQKNFLGAVAGTALGTSRIVGLSGSELFRANQVNIAVFGCDEVKKIAARIERRRVPVGGSTEAGARARAVWGGHDAGANRTSLGVNSFG